MYYLLHRQRVPDKVAKMPDGLAELMSDISREVLRAQPNPHCVYKFVADYLDALLRVREKTLMAGSIIDELIKNTEAISNFLQTAGICYEKANRAAEVVQKAFHEFMKNRGFGISEEPKQFNELELLTELINKCRFTEREILRARPAVRKAYRQFMSDYLNLMKTTVYGASDMVPVTQYTQFHYVVSTTKLDGLHRAAIVIQANFRGYIARQSLRRTSLNFDILITRALQKINFGRKLKRVAPFHPLKYECIRDQMQLCRLHKAAEIIQRSFRRWYYRCLYHYNYPRKILDKASILIQSYYRGYMARKYYKKLKQFDHIRRKYESVYDECELQVYNNSAIKIQSVYRGYRERKQYQRLKETERFKLAYGRLPPEILSKMNQSAARIQRAYRRYKKKKEKKFDMADIVLLAATVKIQSLFRGYIARKRYKKMKQEKREKEEKEEKEEAEKFYTDVTDPQQLRKLNDSATKIQAVFRGSLTRKKLKEERRKSEEENENQEEKEAIPPEESAQTTGGELPKETEQTTVSASGEQTVAPAQETAAPAEESSAPVEESHAPVEESPSAVEESPSAPVEESPAPIEESPTLEEKSEEAPAEGNVATAEETEQKLPPAEEGPVAAEEVPPSEEVPPADGEGIVKETQEETTNVVAEPTEAAEVTA